MGDYLFPTTDQTARELSKRRRMIFSAISGFVSGSICAIVLSFVNVWVYRDLPIHVDPAMFLKMWLLWGLGGSVFGAISAISTDGWGSIVLASILMGAAVLIMNFLQGIDNLFLNFVVLMGLIVPFTGMMMPVAYILFWLGKRFEHAYHVERWSRVGVIVLNVLVVLVLGILPGLYQKFNARAERAVYMVHGMLQGTTSADSQEALPKFLAKAEGYFEHRADAYTLGQKPSLFSTVGIDVTAYYEDGYSVRCTVILYPGSDPYLTACKGFLP